MENERPITAPPDSSVKTTRPPPSSTRASTAHPILSNSSNNNVRVVARIRPLSTKELSEQSSSCLETNTTNSNVNVIKVTNEDKSFEFDAVFNEKSTQEEVYIGTAGDMIENSIYKGFNGTILAYGQTGSGELFE
eukprot:scaffold105689_cov39-Cyclotella_meneghiniana.AAC.2